jgi:hypothetical protein
MRCKAVFYILMLALVFLPIKISALQTDTISVAMEPDSRECFDILLPDNMGVVLPGRFEYRIAVYPEPNETWLDLTEITIRTDESEAVLVPVCFSSAGKPIGNCSEPFELVITAAGPAELPEKRITGRACVARNRDVDTGKAPAKEGEAGTVDVFDMALEKEIQYARPGEPANYTVLMQSQAGVTVDLEVLSEGESIVKKTVEFGDERFAAVNFTLKAAQTGEYGFIVYGKVGGCEDNICAKQVAGTLVVTDNAVSEGSFTVSLFPRNINVKGLEPVDFRASVANNMGSAKGFLLSLELPEGVRSDFSSESVEVPAGGMKTAMFSVTPERGSSQFTIKVNATADVEGKAVTKSATSYLSTDEMLTDVQRLAEEAGTEEADDVVDEYVRRYTDAGYGEEELDDYGEVVGTLEAMTPEENGDGGEYGYDDGTDGAGERGGEGWPMWVYGLMAAAVVGGVLLFIKFFRGGGSGLDQEFKLEK